MKSLLQAGISKARKTPHLGYIHLPCWFLLAHSSSSSVACCHWTTKIFLRREMSTNVYNVLHIETLEVSTPVWHFDRLPPNSLSRSVWFLPCWSPLAWRVIFFIPPPREGSRSRIGTIPHWFDWCLYLKLYNRILLVCVLISDAIVICCHCFKFQSFYGSGDCWGGGGNRILGGRDGFLRCIVIKAS